MLDQYLGEYITVAAFLAMGGLLVAGAMVASSLIRPDKPSPVKSQTYECGIDPVGGGWSQTQIRYYIYGFLFVIFDVEAIFLFPWAIRLEQLGMFGLVEMLIFIWILIMGLAYAIRKGVLRWE